MHECREAAYIAEVERNLLYVKGQMVVHLFQYYLHMETGASRDKIARVSLIHTYSGWK